MSKPERVLNLIFLLLNAQRPLTAAEIRERVPGYDERNDEAFHRMFERDKADVRDMGYVLVQEDTDAWGVEAGYRIDATGGLLDDPGLTADEAAALSLAAQSWGGGTGDGALGFFKLSVGAPGSDPGPGGWFLPRVPLDRNVSVLMDAVARRKRVTFRYRTGGGGQPQERTVDPHGLYHRSAWYLSGYDHDRDGVRHFKLTRVVGPIRVNSGGGADFDEPPRAAPEVPRGPWEGETTLEAQVLFAPEVAWWAERWTGARRGAPPRAGGADDGWVELRLPVADVEAFAGWLAGFADRAEALAPPAVRDAVVEHLRATVEALDVD